MNLISKPEIWEDDFEGDGRKFYTDGPYVHEYLKELVRDTGIEDYVTVGEMSSTTLEHCIRYSGAEEKELSMCFNFHHLKVDYKDGNKWELMEPDYMELKVIFEKWQMGMQRGNAWNALFWCNHDQPRIVSRFGNERILSSVGTIPLIVNNLVKMNYVERMCNEKDRRVCILHLTQEGYDVISKIVPRNEAMIAESMEVLDQEEKEKLLYLLKKIGGKL